ncbi:MAG: hypothetical protein ACE5FW_01780, partial [Candidatus Aenigmatarchaeota archaeon]
IAGFFSTASTRPTTGFLMLGAATIIFGLGPGTQEFGQALLGQWFPAVYKGVSTTFEPLTDAFGQMTGTLGTAFQLLVNPMGFAQRIMNGTYTTDPATGLKGAFGLEIEEFRTTPIYIGQPYSAIVKLKNKGAFEAEKVVVAILPGEKSPKEKIPSLKLYPGDVLKDMRARILVEQAEKVGQEEAVKQLEGLKLFHIPEGLKFSGGIDLAGLGFSTEGACYGGTACWQFVGDVVKLDVRQLFFESKGVSCASLVRYDLHKQFLPLRTIVQYDYKIHSSLAIEFISTGEWDRLVAEELLITQQKKPASLDNAPVRLNIDTLEQPIREGTPLFLGLELTPVKGEVLDPVIQLDVPAELNLDYKNCLPQEVTRKEGDSIIFNFTGKDPPYLVYCPLPPMTGMTEATQTLTVRANADYTFVKTKHTAEKVEFGAIQCCKEDKDCLYAPAGQKCDKTTNICGKVVEVPAVGLGSSKYCEDVRKGSCQLGEGNCKAGECDTQPKYPYKTAADSRGLECRDTNTAGLKVCCWQGATPQECQKAFKLRQDGKERSDLNKEMWGI